MHFQHKEILDLIKSRSGKATTHTFDETYLGNEHPRYPISNPVLRVIAREWISRNKQLSAAAFRDVVDSLIKGESFTEKIMAGFILGYAKNHQRKFDIRIFDSWLGHLEGWAEVDTLCTGDFTKKEVPAEFAAWKPLLVKLNRSRNINKRRASIVILCSPVSHTRDADLASTSFELIENLQGEKHVLITKAISWLLRSMIRHYASEVEMFINSHAATLPAIALRETKTKLATGRKTAG